MPSNKSSFYDGSVILDNSVDNLDVSGWINSKVINTSCPPGTKVLRLSNIGSINVGDRLIKSKTGEFVGKVSARVTTFAHFEPDGIKCSLEADDYVHIYPKFEIVKIEILGPETYISSLLPVDTRHPGTTAPDLDTFSARIVNNFSSLGNLSSSIWGLSNGQVFNAAVLPAGSVIEGRFKRVEIDNSAVAELHSAICYLKASPVIM